MASRIPGGKHARWFSTTVLAAALGLAGILLSACAAVGQSAAVPGSPTPNMTLTVIFQQALDQATRSIPTPTPTASLTPVPPTFTPTPTAIRTPPALPALFSSKVLAKDVLPQTYISDTCTYLKNRWDPNNSAPGTVVMTIMYHSVTEDYKPLLPDGSQVHHSDLEMAFEHATRSASRPSPPPSWPIFSITTPAFPAARC